MFFSEDDGKVTDQKYFLLLHCQVEVEQKHKKNHSKCTSASHPLPALTEEAIVKIFDELYISCQQWKLQKEPWFRPFLNQKWSQSAEWGKCCIYTKNYHCVAVQKNKKQAKKQQHTISGMNRISSCYFLLTLFLLISFSLCCCIMIKFVLYVCLLVFLKTRLHLGFE